MFELGFMRALGRPVFGWSNAAQPFAARTLGFLGEAAAPDGQGGWRINGSKFYCTGALYAQWIPTATVGEDGLQRLAFVRRDSPGV